MKCNFYKSLTIAALLAFFGGCSDGASNATNPISDEVSLEESSSSLLSASSSSSDKKSSSSAKVTEESSSSSAEQKISSSSKVKDSSSSSGVQESSSSVKAAEESSSSSAKQDTSSSSDVQVASSSSDVQETSSSSEVQVSSSSEEVSSSSVVQLIPSKDYDCSQYKCLPTQYLNPEIEYGELLDTRDNQVYRTVKIGDQVWMAQNLNYDLGDTAADPRFIHRFTSKVVDHVEDSLAKYGRAYTWVQAIDTTEVCYDSSCYLPISMLPRRGICPEGWHLPSERDWKLLEKYVDLNNDDEGIGVSLKVPDLWDPYPNAVGTDRFGFSALPFEPKMSTSRPLQIIVFWTSDEYIDNSYYANVRILGYATPNFIKEFRGKSTGFAVRCLQD